MFREIVAACSADHFTASDMPLIVSFVQSTLMARNAIQSASSDKDALLRWDRAVKLQAVLASKLRLCPLSRVDPKTLGRNTPRPHYPRPWSLREGDDHNGKKPWEED